jgi:radical SAM-linked protein
LGIGLYYFSGVQRISSDEREILVLIRFRIFGSLRFLSHIETMSVLKRACVRAGLKMRYSEGYNPRPRLSLPLPRTVGIESEDDLLCVRIEKTEAEFDAEQFMTRLAGQLPAGCEVVSVKAVKDGKCPVPTGAVYRIALKQDVFENEKAKVELRGICSDILGSERIVIERRFGPEGSKSKNIDVRGFVKDIRLIDDSFFVECNVSGEGTIRVEEFLGLLQIKVEQLEGAVRRVKVQWQENN